MKTISPPATDFDSYFERLWNAAAAPGTDRHDQIPGGRVRIECSGESVELDALGVAVVRRAGADLRYVEFICPRCHLVHVAPWLPPDPSV